MTPASILPAVRPTRGPAFLGSAFVVFVLSALAALGVPFLQRAQIENRGTATAADLRTAAAAFQAYAHAHGDWPPADTGPGTLPTGMSDYLDPANWNRSSPIGGRYAWKTGSLHHGHRYAAAIVIVPSSTDSVSVDRRQLEALDRAIDDGDLATGNFRLGFRHRPVFVLEH